MATLKVSNVAAQLTADEWEAVLAECNPGTQRDLITQLSRFNSRVDKSFSTSVYADPRAQFSMMMEMVLDMQGKLRVTLEELATLRAAAEESKSNAQNNRDANKYSEIDLKVSETYQFRKGSYRFGNAKINYIRPSEGYPAARDALVKPAGGLVLEYAHGYQGKEMYGRGNIFYVADEKTGENAIVYHVAGVGVVKNCKEKTQKFFSWHNDDITCIAVSGHPDRPTLVATGQTDPKDFKERDLPKIYIWDWTTMKRLKLIPDAHWGMVLKLQFSSKNDLLFSIGGESDHVLKVWDIKSLHKRGKAGACKELISIPTYREDIFGFVVCPYKVEEKYLEEMLIFGRKKASWCGLQATSKNNMSFKLKAVPFSLLKQVKDKKKLAPKAILCGDWLPNRKFVLGDNTGAIFICDRAKPLCRIQAHKGALGAIFVSQTDKVLTAGNDGHIRSWKINAMCTNAELTSSTKEPISFKDNDFEFLPRAMAFDPVSETVYVGSRTCQIMSYNLVTCSSQILIDGHDDQVWGLTTCNMDGYEHYYITGGYDGVLKLWDCKENDIVDTYEFVRKEREGLKQIVNCIWSNDGLLVAAGSEDGWIYLFIWFRNRTLELVAEYEFPVMKGRDVEGVSYMRFSEDDKILAVAHMDAHLYLFTVSGHGKKWMLEPWKPANHRAAPTHIQWSADRSLIKVLTRDYEVCHWLVNEEGRCLKFYPHLPDPDDVEWAGDPLVAGWDVQGCYQAEWDGTDLNDITLSSDGQFLVAGDDFGIVRLFRYPAISNKPGAHRMYLGHSSFVVGVEFCRNDEYLITCGGNDMAVFQWKLEKY